MSCGHCVNHVKEALEQLDEVIGVDVSLNDKSAILDSHNDISDKDIKFAVEDAGYEVVKIEIL